MILSTLSSIATAITISVSNPTTMIFKDPIQFISIGKTGDYSVFLNNSKKVVILQPVRAQALSDLVVVTDKSNYQFKVHIGSESTQSYFQISDGLKNNSYTLSLKTESYEVYEGSTSVLLKNISQNDIEINGEKVKKSTSTYLPKGGNIYLDNKRIY